MNPNIPSSRKKRVVIIGGGFGGLKLARKLYRTNYQLVLLDKTNYHQFQPLLYQVASAGLNPGSIAFPFRKDFHHYKNFHFRMTSVLKIVAEENKIITTIGEICYDYLAIAAGTDTNYYGMDNIRQKAWPMKSVTEAMALRNKILTDLENAMTMENKEIQQALMNVVVVGGGASGVEVSGALSEMKRFILQKDYPELARKKFNIYLVEGTSKLLGNMTEKASEKALEYLKKMDVKVMLNKKVVDYKDNHIIFEDGKSILSASVIWVSGVTANRFQGIPNELIGRGGRIMVDEYNRVKGFENIFAIGDIALLSEDKYPNGHPQVAQAAIQQGHLLAYNLKCLSQKKPLKPFHYKNKGTLATVGRNKAVADLPYLKTQGWFAWFMWMGVHLSTILGVRNRLEILLNWVWNYFTYDQAIRLIFKNGEQKE